MFGIPYDNVHHNLDFTCPGCDGMPTTCLSCDGHRMIPCPEHGLAADPECPVCEGQGEVECPKCDGNGTTTCDLCGGMGNILVSGGLLFPITLPSTKDIAEKRRLAAENGWMLVEWRAQWWLVEIGTGQDSTWERAYVYLLLTGKVPAEAALALRRGGQVFISPENARKVERASVLTLEAVAAEAYTKADELEQIDLSTPEPTPEASQDDAPDSGYGQCWMIRLRPEKYCVFAPFTDEGFQKLSKMRLEDKRLQKGTIVNVLQLLRVKWYTVYLSGSQLLEAAPEEPHGCE